MVELAKFNTLTVIRKRSVGVFFDGGDDGDILMPNRHLPEDELEVGETLDVFVFLDADERLTATVMEPMAERDEVAYLKVVAIHSSGAFLDWGLTKDLFVPRFAQCGFLEVGQSYLTQIKVNEEDEQIYGEQRLKEILSDTVPRGRFKPKQAVTALVAEDTELGYRVIVNHQFWGLLYKEKHHKPLKQGQMVTAYVTKVRADGKLDLSLEKPGFQKNKVTQLADRIVEALEQEKGFLSLHDKSPPEEIYRRFGVSKKAYKTALGSLYKDRKIEFVEGGVRLKTR